MLRATASKFTSASPDVNRCVLGTCSFCIYLFNIITVLRVNKSLSAFSFIHASEGKEKEKKKHALMASVSKFPLPRRDPNIAR